MWTECLQPMTTKCCTRRIIQSASAHHDSVRGLAFFTSVPTMRPVMAQSYSQVYKTRCATCHIEFNRFCAAHLGFNSKYLSNMVLLNYVLATLALVPRTKVLILSRLPRPQRPTGAASRYQTAGHGLEGVGPRIV